MSRTVSESELTAIMARIRDLRAWALRHRVDPWAVRQALLIALEMDTDAALHRGVTREELANFDLEVKEDIRAWITQERRRP